MFEAEEYEYRQDLSEQREILSEEPYSEEELDDLAKDIEARLMGA